VQRRFINNVGVGLRISAREVETNMNEGDKFFARESAVLYEFLQLVRRALLVEADERKMPNMFDSTHFPKPKVSVETLEESVKNGLPLHLAVYSYDQIERTAENTFTSFAESSASHTTVLFKFVRCTDVKSSRVRASIKLHARHRDG